MSEYHPNYPRCRSETPRHDGVTCPSLPPITPPTQTTADVLPPEEQASGSHADIPLPLRPSLRKGRSRGRHESQNRTRDTPPMMLAFLEKGADQEKARGASAVPQELPYRGLDSSLKDLPNTSATPGHPMKIHTSPTSTIPALYTHGGPGETHRKSFSDPHHFNVPDQAEGPPYFHVTATYNARRGGVIEWAWANWNERVGFWNSLAAAREAAERHSRLPKFHKFVRVLVETKLMDGGTEAKLRNNKDFRGEPISEPWPEVTMEIVESLSRLPEDSLFE